MVENNTIEINVQTGEVIETYVEPIQYPKYVPTRYDYNSLVDAKIRERYSISQELAILRQQNEKLDEWKEYFDFCELCKIEAKKELNYEELSK